MPALPRLIASVPVASVLLLALTGCGGTAAIASSGSAAEPAAAASEWPTCEEIIPDVVDISAAQGEPSIVQVYSPTVVADRTADYDSGALTIPEGSTSVAVLECSGTSAWTDQDELVVNYRLEMDLNQDMLVSYEPVMTEQ